MKLPEKQIDEENKEIETLEKEISDLLEQTKTNIHRQMLKIWAIGVLVVLGGFFLAALVGWGFSHFVALPTPSPDTFLSKIEEITPALFTATATINGLIIGFVPLCSFFFLRGVSETEHEFRQEWEERRKESKGEKQELIDKHYKLLSIVGNNLRSGVLTYTRTYIVTSIFLQIYLVFLFVTLSVNQATSLYILIDAFFMTIIFVGMVPIINIALYKPALRPIRYFIVAGEVTRFEPER